MQKAESAFSQYGYEAASLESIAKACAITKPAIYYHFKDKASLYEAVLLKRLSALAEVILANTRSDDPEEALKAYIETFGNYMMGTPSFSAMFSREIANDAKAMSQSCIVSLSQTLQRLSDILKRGKEQGVFECENPFMIQMMIVTTLSADLTTKSLRKRVFEVIEKREPAIKPDIENLIDNLSQKIIKALTC